MSIGRNARRNAVAAKRGHAIGYVASGNSLVAENDEPEPEVQHAGGHRSERYHRGADKDEAPSLQRAIDQRRGQL